MNDSEKNKNLPKFLVIGAMKSGTTSLHNILRQHSQIFLPPGKEVHFFDIDRNYKKGIDYYASFFKDADEKQLIGEITPGYIWKPYIAERIFKGLGNKTKLIAILRNPATRVYSQYKMWMIRGETNEPLRETIENELKQIHNKKNYCYNKGYVSRGFYARQIKTYLKYFPLEQMHFILFEDDFIKKPKETLKNIFEFLNLNYEDNIVNIKSHITGKLKSKSFDYILNTPNLINRIAKKLISSEKNRVLLKAKLEDINLDKSYFPDEEFESLKPMLIKDVYYDDIKELEKIINRDLSSWYKDIL